MRTATRAAREMLAKWNPLDPAQLDDPYPSYALARRQAPVFYNEYFDAWCVTRYEDVLAAVKDTSRLSSREATGSDRVPDELVSLLPNGYPWSEPTLVNNDPPAHTRVRRLVNEAFCRPLIAARESEIARIVEGLIDEFESAEHCDLVSQFAKPLPVIVICRLLGVPDEHAAQVVTWSEAKLGMINPNLDDDTLIALARGQANFYDFCEAFIEEQRTLRHSDTLVRHLLDARSTGDEPVLTQREVISVVAQLLLGGNSTTRRLITNMMLRLNEHPAQLEAIRVDSSLARAAVEESLRHTTSVKGLYRTATATFRLGRVTIPEGARVVVFWASANRDETKFERADEFDIFRPDTERHIAFSRFAHFCLGASLARLEARLALDKLLSRLPDLRLAGTDAYAWEPLALHQGLSRMDVQWR
jgi:cytochrome P450